jgi:hypothetical protein
MRGLNLPESGSLENDSKTIHRKKWIFPSATSTKLFLSIKKLSRRFDAEPFSAEHFFMYCLMENFKMNPVLKNAKFSKKSNSWQK